MNSVTTNGTHRVLRLKEVCERCAISRSSVYVKLQIGHPGHDPLFPRPVSLGRRAIGFIEAEVVAWLDLKLARRAA